MRAAESADRRACQTVMHALLQARPAPRVTEVGATLCLSLELATWKSLRLCPLSEALCMQMTIATLNLPRQNVIQMSSMSSITSSARRAAERARRAWQGLLPLLAPMTPHLAEDAWQNLPWAPPTRSVFQAGWFCAPDAWRSLPQDTVAVFRALLTLRCRPTSLRMWPWQGWARRVIKEICISALLLASLCPHPQHATGHSLSSWLAMRAPMSLHDAWKPRPRLA